MAAFGQLEPHMPSTCNGLIAYGAACQTLIVLMS